MREQTRRSAKVAAVAETRPGLAGELEEQRTWLLGLLTRFTGDPAAAQDIVQDAYLKALAGDGPGEPDKLRGWLAAVALNCARDKARKAQRANQALQAGAASDWHEDERPGPLQALLQTEMSSCIAEFVDRLPDDQRRAVALHDLIGLPHREIAARIGVSEANARVLLHRGRRRLGELLGESCELDFGGDAIPCARKPRQ